MRKEMAGTGMVEKEERGKGKHLTRACPVVFSRAGAELTVSSWSACRANGIMEQNKSRCPLTLRHGVPQASLGPPRFEREAQGLFRTGLFNHHGAEPIQGHLAS